MLCAPRRIPRRLRSLMFSPSGRFAEQGPTLAGGGVAPPDYCVHCAASIDSTHCEAFLFRRFSPDRTNIQLYGCGALLTKQEGGPHTGCGSPSVFCVFRACFSGQDPGCLAGTSSNSPPACGSGLVPPRALPIPFRASPTSLGMIHSLLELPSASFGSVWRYW